MEEEAKVGYLANSEFWLFTDNSTAKSCFFKVGSSSKALHDLVLRLKRVELEAGFTLYIVHVAGDSDNCPRNQRFVRRNNP
jgi:hypothetical protein